MSTTVLAPKIECKDVALKAGDKAYKFHTGFRCDHSSTVGLSTCGAQAYVAYTLRSGGELLFCLHHAKEEDPFLRPISTKRYTEESRLVEDRKKGSEN
jgi:hypothetical protein